MCEVEHPSAVVGGVISTKVLLALDLFSARWIGRLSGCVHGTSQDPASVMERHLSCENCRVPPCAIAAVISGAVFLVNSD